ncbi:hypothetical protein ElyMa_000809000 [Elysia marginata]|uniref:WAP domain-containing protein n=1 Tax=Elysia marginata TaxID=1093978 RepID=A0AAV4GYA3_9GAST|nr:hypothetical protein ElyMa_000809000 [Elysia marginata]
MYLSSIKSMLQVAQAVLTVLFILSCLSSRSCAASESSVVELSADCVKLCEAADVGCKADNEECKKTCSTGCRCMYTCDIGCGNTFDFCKQQSSDFLNAIKCAGPYLECQANCKINCGLAGMFMTARNLLGKTETEGEQ